MKSERSADRVYRTLRDMATRFAFKPGERINEVDLAAALGCSRTPLREALNRLAAEGFLTFRAGQGFSCRSLEPADIFDLYEARQSIECEAARLAALRAAPEDVTALIEFLTETQAQYRSGCPVEQLVDLDEAFHLQVLRLSGNREMERLLQNLNARLRFVRWIDMEERREITPDDHMRVARAIASGDGHAAAEAMRDHISRRKDQATEAARKAYSRIYVPQ